MKKRGKKPRYAVYNGIIIEGLYIAFNPDRTVRNYYYLDSNGRQVSCTSDLPEAVRRFRKFHLEQTGGRYSTIPENEQIIPIGQYGGIYDPERVSDQYIIRRFVELLKEDRYRVAELSGIDKFAHIEDIVPLPKSQNLSDLLNIYSNHKIDKYYLKTVRRHWNEFRKVVGKDIVRLVTYDDVTRYNDNIHSQSNSPKINNKPRYINNRFNAIRSVLQYCTRKIEYKKDIDRILEYLQQLSFAKDKPHKVVIVTPEEFQILFEASQSNPMGRCMLLLGLNCALRSSDISDIRKKDVDLKNSKFSKPRTKTNVIQSSVLWKETKDALKEYMRLYPNKTEYIFVTKYNRPYKYKYLIPYFNRLREKDVSHITHNMLRKSANSTANQYGLNPNGIKILMGWSIGGVDNSYNERPAEATAESVKVIHHKYFPKSANGAASGCPE
jgi:integrase